MHTSLIPLTSQLNITITDFLADSASHAARSLDAGVALAGSPAVAAEPSGGLRAALVIILLALLVVVIAEQLHAERRRRRPTHNQPLADPDPAVRRRP